MSASFSTTVSGRRRSVTTSESQAFRKRALMASQLRSSLAISADNQATAFSIVPVFSRFSKIFSPSGTRSSTALTNARGVRATTSSVTRSLPRANVNRVYPRCSLAQRASLLSAVFLTKAKILAPTACAKATTRSRVG
jgi:hypothetical protein